MTTQTTLSARAWAELLLLALVWGGVFLAMRIALDEVPVLTVVLHRVGWAALVLWGIVFAIGLPRPKGLGVWGAFLIMGALNNAVPFGLMTWGQLHIDTGLTSILNAATAIFGVVVAAAVFADERLTLQKSVGVMLGFFGVATAIGLKALTDFNVQSWAQLAVIAGTVSYAFAAAWGRAKLGHLHPLVSAAGMLTGATLLLAPAALWLDGLPQLALSAKTWGAIVYYALFATALAYLLYYRVLAMAGSGNLMLVTLLMPPIAIVLGALVRNEALELRALLGFVILGVGLLVLNGTLWPKQD